MANHRNISVVTMHPHEYNARKSASGGQMTPADYGLAKAAYSVNETLTLLSIGRTSLYQLVQRGDLKPAKLGKKTLFYAADIAALLMKLREPNREVCRDYIVRGPAT